jgi:hypothetical protein
MIKLEGEVINVFHMDAGKNKKGEEYDARDKIQLLGELELPNGETKKELIDLTVSDIDQYVGLVGKTISIAAGAMSAGRAVIFYVRKGAKPTVLA